MAGDSHRGTGRPAFKYPLYEEIPQHLPLCLILHPLYELGGRLKRVFLKHGAEVLIIREPGGLGYLADAIKAADAYGHYFLGE